MENYYVVYVDLEGGHGVQTEAESMEAAIALVLANSIGQVAYVQAQLIQ